MGVFFQYSAINSVFLLVIMLIGLTPMTNAADQRLPSYFPNTEAVQPDEMRVTALGTGLPTPITRAQKATSWMVELGNGDVFLFDLGTGSMTNLFGLRPDFSKMDKVFLSHLHSDHFGDLDAFIIGSWLSGRYTPLHVYGGSGSTPELGTAAAVNYLMKALAWDIKGRSGLLPDEGGKVIAHEFDYKQENQVVYQRNGVTITSWPAIHSLDGSVSYRLEWRLVRVIPRILWTTFASSSNVS
jgi:ribonuclease Z